MVVDNPEKKAVTQDQQHCPHPLDVIVYRAGGRTCTWCGLTNQDWDDAPKDERLPWPPNVLPAGESSGYRAAPSGDSLRKVAESFEFEPDFRSWDEKLQARDVVKLERKLFEGLAAALREGAPKNWWTIERIQRKWSELVKSAGRELGDQDGFVRMVERGSA